MSAEKYLPIANHLRKPAYKDMLVSSYHSQTKLLWTLQGLYNTLVIFRPPVVLGKIWRSRKCNSCALASQWKSEFQVLLVLIGEMESFHPEAADAALSSSSSVTVITSASQILSNTIKGNAMWKITAFHSRCLLKSMRTFPFRITISQYLDN